VPAQTLAMKKENYRKFYRIICIVLWQINPEIITIFD